MSRLRAVFCAVFRHSRIATCWFGYQYCGRCGAQVGDSLAGVSNPGIVFPSSRRRHGRRLPLRNCEVVMDRLGTAASADESG